MNSRVVHKEAFVTIFLGNKFFNSNSLYKSSKGFLVKIFMLRSASSTMKISYVEAELEAEGVNFPGKQKQIEMTISASLEKYRGFL